MKIIAINSSSHGATGATQEILSPFLEGAKSAGCEAETIFLKKKNIQPCLACISCWLKTPGRCIQQDDMGSLLAKLKESDLLIFAGPVYVDGISALGKLFLDRLIPLMDCHLIVKDDHTRHPVTQQGLPRVFGIVTCGFYEKDNTDVWIENLKRACKNFEMEYLGSLMRPASHILFWKKDYGHAIDSIKQTSYQAGFELVNKGRVSLDLIEKVGVNFVTRDEMINTSNASWDRHLRKARNTPVF